ncbi:MAG TPA: zf-HC2 domain-containing protein [Candidatus Polarisedimenticolia bacterium]|nr:zf-HC2 domain-containing protein [Candidatus Polarisedimenticolia bacterium]
MTHEKFQELLGDYAEGMLPVGAMSAFGRHLASCPSCAALTDAYTSALADLHAFPRLEVPSGFTERVLARTTRRPPLWSVVAGWLGLPRLRLNPAAAGALCSLVLVLVMGTSEGKRVVRELNMATHRTYSNAVRLYVKSSDLKETAAAVGKQIPGRLEGTVDWVRERWGKKPENAPEPKREGGESNSRQVTDAPASA